MGSEHCAGVLPYTCVGVAVAAACLTYIPQAHAQQQSVEGVGATYQLSMRYETSKTGSDGSSSSSSGTEGLLERVIEVRPSGIVLEYDFPRYATAEDRAREWKFPARVFLSDRGEYSLLNAENMRSRVDAWLKATSLSRAACGRWVFTWDAFKIECDPQSVVTGIEHLSLRWPVPCDGATFSDERAAKPTVFRRVASSPTGSTFVAQLVIDGARVRRQQAEADMAVGELNQKPITFDSAYRARARDEIVGTLTITFETDPAGNVKRRKTVKLLDTRRESGVVEHATETEIVERRSLR